MYHKVFCSAIAGMLIANLAPVKADGSLEQPALIIVRPQYGEGAVIAQQLIELQTGSTLFRSLKEALQRRSTRVYVTPLEERHHNPRLIGVTRLGVDGPTLVAHMTVRVDLQQPRLTADALAHEFAHVLEASCARRPGNGLVPVLGMRNFEEVGMIETRFAGIVGRAVVAELQSERRPTALDEVSSIGLAACLR